MNSNCSNLLNMRNLKEQFKDGILLIFEITRTIYSNSEMSEQLLVTECILTFSWRFLIFNKLEQLEFKLEKIIWI